MQTIEQTITINAPPKVVFDFINDPQSIRKLWSSVVEVSNVQQLPNGGTRFQFVYRMAGIRLKSVSEDLECVFHSRVVNKTTGGVESTMTWTFSPEDGGAKTHLHLKVDYLVPIPLVGWLAEIVVAKINESEVSMMLACLKVESESLAEVERIRDAVR